MRSPYPSAPARDEDECCDLCAAHEGCVGAVYGRQNPRTGGKPDYCWFKDAATAVQANEEKREGNSACLLGK